MTAAIDLNADLGEGMSGDEALLGIVSSASVACGGHAGDAATMGMTVRAAHRRGVRIGAHPGFADREHFGRRRLNLGEEELRDLVSTQVRDLATIAHAEGAGLAFVKLHGALANMAAEDPRLAGNCFAAAREVVPAIAALAIDRSAQVTAAEAIGMPVIREAYADRGYQPDGLLLPRSEPGSVLHDVAEISARVVRMAQRGEIVAVDGTVLRSSARSICIHGDTPDAVAIAIAVRRALKRAGIAVRAQT